MVNKQVFEEDKQKKEEGKEMQNHSLYVDLLLLFVE